MSRALLAALLLVLSTATTGRADILEVPGDYLTIQAAINMAVDGDEIVVSPGVHDGDFQIDKSIVVRSIDPLDAAFVEATIVTLTDDAYEPIVTMLEGELSGITVTGGDQYYHEAGAVIINGNVTLSHCVIRAIVAGDEPFGSVVVEAGAPVIVDCTFAENTGSYGGAVSVIGGGPSITASTFVGNTAYIGGGVMIFPTFDGPVLIQACQFVGNSASYGAAVYVEASATPPWLADNTGCGNGPSSVDGPWVDGGGNEFVTTCDGDCNTNFVPDEDDIANGTSADCNANGIPDECDISSGRSADCNGNGVPDDCDITGGTSLDCDGNGIPDECGVDCNGNGVPDVCDIADGTSLDCNGNGVPDECGEVDCNGNGVPDDCDIADGVSADCNENGVPDECEPDCNGNGIADACDIADGTSDDCNGNGVPDSCELANGTQSDCNGNGVLDECDIANGTSVDCNGNGIPDACDLFDGTAVDCDGNGVPDSCDIADGSLDDCNANGLADLCEEDANGDGIADDCQPARNLTTNVFYATIQEAIDDAQDGHEIMVMPGIYAPPPFPDATASISGKSITFRSSDPTDPAVVAATVIGRIVCGGTAASATVIDGFTLAMGDHPIADHALAVSDSSPLIRRCAMEGTTGFGLALVNAGAMPTFEGCRFIGNELSSAAIWVWDDGAAPVLVDTIVCGNSGGQISGAWSDGGGNTIDAVCPACVLPTGVFPSALLDNTTGFADWTYLQGPPGEDYDVGIGGQVVTYDFGAAAVLDGPGVDLNVYEVDNGGPEFSVIDVLVSHDGHTWISVKDSETDLLRVVGDASLCCDQFGRSYDLNGSGLGTARYVRIDGDGDAPAGPNAGFDLSLVAAVHVEGPPNPCCPADVDGSGAVDVLDLVAVITAWGSTNDPVADINDDGFVDVADLTAVIVNWGACSQG